MARRTTAQTADVEAENVPEHESGDEFTFEVRETDAVIRHVRPEKPNPLLDAFRKSLDTGKTLEIPVRGEDHAKTATNLLRRAAKSLDVGLSVRHYPDAGVVRFRAKAEKIKRSYTAVEVREWAKANGATDDMLYPRIAKNVREAFKAAHNDADSTDA